LRRGIVALALGLLVLAVPPAMAAEHAKATVKTPGSPNDPVYIKLPAIVLPVFEGNEVARQAGLILTLELVKGKSDADVLPNERKLQDAFITELYNIYEQHGGSERVIEPTVIKQRLQSASDRVLGAGVVSQILIQQAFERTHKR
jgi:hypothetical protein